MKPDPLDQGWGAELPLCTACGFVWRLLPEFHTKGLDGESTFGSLTNPVSGAQGSLESSSPFQGYDHGQISVQGLPEPPALLWGIVGYT